MEICDFIKGPANRQPPLPPPLLSQPQSLGYTYQDLYPFAVHDSPLWIELFLLADQANRELARGLETIRTFGAWLLLDDTYGFYIEPVIHTAGELGWPNRERYDADRDRFLVPHKQLLIQALKQLRTKYDTGLIISGHQLPPELLTAGIIDPGAGISPKDSMLWIWLLLRSRDIDANFNAILTWIRHTGAQLIPDRQYGYRLSPIIDPAGQRGWPSKQAYDRETQQWMTPYTNLLIQGLSWLSQLGGVA